jgi:O-antigen/teichoic acid export membrane protein
LVKPIESRTLNSTLYGFILLALTFVQSILLVPILISNWGTEKYGIYLNIFAFIQILRTLDFGHQNFIGNEFNREYHRNKDRASHLLTSSIRMAIMLGFVEVVVFVGFWLSGKADTLLGISGENANLILFGILCMVLMWWLIGSVAGTLIKAVVSKGLFAQSVLWGILIKVLEIIVLLVAGIYNVSLFHVLWIWALINMLYSLIVFRWIWFHLEEIGIHWRKGSWKEAFSNAKNSTVLTLNSMFEQFSTNGINFLITRYISLLLLPVYTTLRTITNMAVQMTNLIMNPLQPELIRYHSEQSGHKIASVTKTYWLIGGAMVNITLLALTPFMSWLYAVWTNQQLQFDPILFYLLCLSVAVANFGKTWTTYLVGSNDLKAITMMSVARFGIIFTIIYFAAGHYGLVAIGWAVLNGEIISSLILPFILTRAKMRNFNAAFHVKDILVALLPVGILGMCFWIIVFYGGSIWWVSSLGIILMTISYAVMWQRLDTEVQTRLKTLLQRFILLKRPAV